MSVVVVMGGKAAPGATTTALALACTWPASGRLVVEADPDGGVLAARFGLGHEPGLVSLAAAARRDLDAGTVGAHTQPLGDHGLAALAAPPVPGQVIGALRALGTGLAAALGSMGDVGVAVDVGRAWPDAPAVRPLVERADGVLVVARPRLEEVGQLRARWQAARALNRHVGVILIGHSPYAPGEVGAALDPVDAPLVVWGVLDDDALGADVLNGRRFAPPWGLRKSQLLRSARRVATDAAARLGLDEAPALAHPNGEAPAAVRGRVRTGEGAR